ncbi:hypothetical protein [Acinetobacter bereziniae]|uniref:hypothetical protein n=1 Tax=Acinetobacter bereziniae TaxID=106648 RepID=UPI0025787B29|nr:hypothetical protein [Acinetobacter bereziniae]MDM1784248.1 hypothetical protein [Acinetobacter bereziniae]
MDKLFELLEKLISNPKYTFLGIAILAPFAIAFLWGKVKEVGMFKDVASLKNRSKTSRVEQLNLRRDNQIYLAREKELFNYEIKVIEYQNFLKTNESHLPTLIYLNGYENTTFAIYIFNNCRDLIKFNDEKNKFELKERISDVEAKIISHIGAGIFFLMSLGAYFLMIYFLYLHEVYGVAKDYVVVWGIFNFVLMLIIIFLASRIMRFFNKRKHALLLLNLDRINVKYGENIDK